MMLFQTENILLRSLGFETSVNLPFHLALTYLQTLGLLVPSSSSKSTLLAAKTIEYLNLALFSPQLLYLTHQPPALAVAAIYLAAREASIKLPGNEWWEVFDVDREDLGFLVVALLSCRGWVEDEKEKWVTRSCPLTVAELEVELKMA